MRSISIGIRWNRLSVQKSLWDRRAISIISSQCTKSKNQDDYYKELPGLLQKCPEAERRALHVGLDDRSRIIPVLKQLFKKQIIKNLYLVFEDGQHNYIYKLEYWDSYFVRRYEVSGSTIPLGIRQSKESRAYSLDRKEMKCGRCREDIIGLPAFQCRHTFLCKVCSERSGVSCCSDCSIENRSGAVSSSQHKKTPLCKKCKSAPIICYSVECSHPAFCGICLRSYVRVKGRYCPECGKEATFKIIEEERARYLKECSHYIDSPEPAFNEAPSIAKEEEPSAYSFTDQEFEIVRKKTLRDDLRDWGIKAFIDGKCCKCNLNWVESGAIECGHSLFCQLCLTDYKKSPFDRLCPVCLQEGITYEMWDVDPPAYVLVPDKIDLSDDEEYQEYLRTCKEDEEFDFSEFIDEKV